MNPPQVSPIYLQATSGPIYNQNIINTSVLVIKNAPSNVTVHDIIVFLNGYGEVGKFVEKKKNVHLINKQN